MDNIHWIWFEWLAGRMNMVLPIAALFQEFQEEKKTTKKQIPVNEWFFRFP